MAYSFFDWSALQRPASPNTWLVAPAGVLPIVSDEDAPSISATAVALAQTWRDVLAQQPRIAFMAVSDDGLHLEAVQRSRMFRFPDRISVRIFDLSPGSVSFAAYSRAEMGYYDLGVNRRRLRRWIGEVMAAMEPGQ